MGVAPVDVATSVVDTCRLLWHARRLEFGFDLPICRSIRIWLTAESRKPLHANSTRLKLSLQLPLSAVNSLSFATHTTTR